MLTEAGAEVGVTAETAVGGYLHDALLGLFDQQLGGIFQTELLYIAAQLRMFRTLGEDGSDALLRQLEAVDDGLTSERGVEEEMFAHDDIVDMLEELLVGQCCLVGVGCRCMFAYLSPIFLLVGHMPRR